MDLRLRRLKPSRYLQRILEHRAANALASSDLAPAGISPVSARAEGGDRGDTEALGPALSFGELDSWVCRASLARARVVYVQGHRALLDAYKAHIERRARAVGRPVLGVGLFSDEDPWREISLRLSVNAASAPRDAADEIGSKAGGALLVLREYLARRSVWGRAVAEQLALGDGRPEASALVLVLVEALPAELPKGSCFCELPAKLGSEDAKRVWDGLFAQAEHAEALGLGRLDTLHAWWQRALSVNSAAPLSPLSVSDEARRLHARIVLSGRALSLENVACLGSIQARNELLDCRAIAVDEGGRVVEGAMDIGFGASHEIDENDALCVARMLLGLRHPDGWALIRASELFARARRLDDAEHAAARAISQVIDAEARADFWRRWTAVLKGLLASEKENAKARLLGTVDLALRIGDAEKALEIASIAIAEYGETYETALSLGRALLARGDLLTATVPLRKALERAPDAGSGAFAAVELSEAFYMAGDYDEARRFAELGLSRARDSKTLLLARNLIGKLYLAASQWTQAELHFAADAGEAVCTGDFKAELRAHLNRGVALYSAARWREARAIFEDVLMRARARDEFPAIAFALTNLAAIAIAEHDYANALQWSEESVNVVLRIGDRVRLSLMIANLAELRTNLGLLGEAEQTLVFGRKVNGTAMLPARAAHLALVAARIQLARGDTKRARAELTSAFACAEGAGARGKLGECYRVAARVALEDGDLERAGEVLEKARGCELSRYARAEVALLEALLERARGLPFRAAARRALSLSQEVPFEELAREANTLLCHEALACGDEAAARAFLQAALGIRDRLASALSTDVRARFLARRAFLELGELETRLREAPEEEGGEGKGAVLPFPTLSVSSAADAPHQKERAKSKLVGREPSMLALMRAIQKIGASDTTVLIQGESGTGKELVAEAIHQASRRAKGPLLKVNCAALVESLLLSELFGHEKGSFTGAGAKRRGRFELADKGTLFLDEIGDISPGTQVALLRVLQHKTFERVGGTASIQSDVRIVCATHRDLKAMVQRGQFREDLYYRLCGVVLQVPALRSRIGDLPLIADELLAEIARERHQAPKRLSPCAIEFLCAYSWPGNIRELWNALGAASVFSEGDLLRAEDFAAAVDDLRALYEARQAEQAQKEELCESDDMSSEDEPAPSNARAPGRTEQAVLELGSKGQASDMAYAYVRSGVGLGELKRTIERDCIARALAESRGNITRAAALLGMKRPRLSQLVKHYGFGGCSEE